MLGCRTHVAVVAVRTPPAAAGRVSVQRYVQSDIDLLPADAAANVHAPSALVQPVTTMAGSGVASVVEVVNSAYGAAAGRSLAGSTLILRPMTVPSLSEDFGSVSEGIWPRGTPRAFVETPLACGVPFTVQTTSHVV